MLNNEQKTRNNLSKNNNSILIQLPGIKGTVKGRQLSIMNKNSNTKKNKGKLTKGNIKHINTFITNNNITNSNSKHNYSSNNPITTNHNINKDNDQTIVPQFKPKKPSKPPKDTSDQICDLFFFSETKHIFLFIPNSSYNLCQIPASSLYTPFTIKPQTTIPFKYKMRIYNYENMPECISGPIQRSNIALKTKLENSNLIWHLFPNDQIRRICFQLVPNQKYNHFPFAFQLGRKDNMYRHHRFFKTKFPKEYKFVPKTYLLPADEAAYRKKIATGKKCLLWIAKPVNSSRGRGVHLLKDNNEFEKLLKLSMNDSNSQYLLSKYIADPHLINMKKYDLRIYVLITSFNPLKIYIYKEGLVRFATENYSKSNTDNIYVHLTNYSINKHNTNYISNLNEGNEEDDKSSKWSLEEYRNYFIQQGKEEQLKLIQRRIEDIVIKTLITVSEEATTQIPFNKRDSLFELYGFDILIDANFKAWLIEVNVNASLMCTSPLDLKIKTDLISDTFNIVGIVPYHHNYPSEVYRIPEGEDYGYVNNEGMDEGEDEEVPCIVKLPPIVNGKGSKLKGMLGVKAKIAKDFDRNNMKAYNEEYGSDYYKGVIEEMREEFTRASVTDYDLVFPLKSNIDYYSKFLMYEKNPNDENIVAWQYILTH